MNNISFVEDGYPRIYTLHSQKGGVGKTSVALALAGISGARGKKTLLIDADMTGASIADVPGMECEAGNSTKWFNDLILTNPNEFTIITSLTSAFQVSEDMKLEAKFCRKTTNHESVYFIPSSAKPEAVETVVPLIAQEDHLHFFRHRIEDIIAAAIRTGFEVIILDHSPGLFGFSKTSLEMSLEWSLPKDKTNHRLRYLLYGKSPEPSLQALLVSGFEPHDYKTVLPSFSHVLNKLSFALKIDGNKGYELFANGFRIIFNKAQNISDVLDAVKEMLDKIGGLSPELIQIIIDQEKEFGSQLAPFIEGFSMGNICSKAKAFVSRSKSGAADGKWENWFWTLARRARLIKEEKIHGIGSAE